ncbi:hypothetical protein diail_1992 [Diaporthe ilicicola]|nr:hypothetical protein diail_1992 [Diaporthe ilicicola]
MKTNSQLSCHPRACQSYFGPRCIGDSRWLRAPAAILQTSRLHYATWALRWATQAPIPKTLTSAAACANDIASLRDGALLPLIEQQQKDVVIFAHSFGAIVASGAAKGLDKKTRIGHGQAGGVIGLVYFAGNIVLDNESLAGASGGNYPPFIKLDKPSKVLPSSSQPWMFFTTTVTHRRRLTSRVLWCPMHTMYSALKAKTPTPAWADAAFDGRRAYIRTLNDWCNPVFVQDMWRERTNVHWDVAELKAGHMPFISQPDIGSSGQGSCEFCSGLHGTVKL